MRNINKEIIREKNGIIKRNKNNKEDIEKLIYQL